MDNVTLGMTSAEGVGKMTRAMQLLHHCRVVAMPEGGEAFHQRQSYSVAPSGDLGEVGVCVAKGVDDALHLGVPARTEVACLPQFFSAVEIDGQPYWDGGFSSNPALQPLVESTATPDIIIVQINPIIRHEAPRSARDIINRVNEISFNTALIKELRAIYLMQRLIAAEDLDIGVAGRTFLHMIHAEVEVQELAASSKMNAEWSYLRSLFERGRRWADAWLDKHFVAIGRRSTLDLDELFSEPARPNGLRPLAGE